ncbi:MAG: acetyl-CoA carboxylase, carboxyltransferase subunit beta [Saprospiraceae bacterium]|jgi:acetyl-CoA carboxylase carboxyl transferase subunit beta|nr:acetyl-CoA carboxylase, carboxyltransferase subunit beta [Saprospiraceae bacterium]MDP4820860.1 acetyl-CoA carboxylase, carboxyltransferase subunit beta [Saprospiraceae bacterium]MDP4999069.1 acetyl-CoA carboxylase, carboxyltransferase subunit beta [Saprospiraceae bacterium]
MGWFKRLKDGIQTATRNKKEAPEGLWYKCEKCKQTSTRKELKENFHKCPKCNYHVRIGSAEYFEIIFDGQYEVLFDDLIAMDALDFSDLKPYSQRLIEAKTKTDLNDAMAVGVGKVHRKPLVIAAMDFQFIGGSMGTVVGEKISRAIDHCLQHRIPLLIISRSGGARMMESAYSLMQMAKTSAKLSLMAKAGIPYISLMTDPTTGGVTASFAMLGDLNIAEPEALIGFAGPRVIKETIKRDLPDGFQTSEFLLEHGFLDFIVDRKDLKERLGDLLGFFHLS